MNDGADCVCAGSLAFLPPPTLRLWMACPCAMDAFRLPVSRRRLVVVLLFGSSA